MSSEILWDGKTVWINTPQGMCVGRFSQMGIDIHHDFLKQQTEGTQCLQCKKGPCTLEDWDTFVEGMKTHYKINIPQKAMPRYLKTPKKKASK